MMFEAVLMAMSLCADCFAVSLCSSVTIRRVSAGSVARVAVCFAVIQTGLLLAGWFFGALFVGAVEKVSKWIGFGLLLYVGGSMLLEGLKGEDKARDLDGLVNVLIGGVATSIDALAVGVARSMQARPVGALAVSVAVVTALSVVLGICSGKAIGTRFGRWAEIGGGAVLIIIGITILI